MHWENCAAVTSTFEFELVHGSSKSLKREHAGFALRVLIASKMKITFSFALATLKRNEEY